MTVQTRHTLLLVLTAFLWGLAFVAQSVSAGMGAFTFLACRSWLAVAALLPTAWAFGAVRRRRGVPDGRPATAAARRTLRAGGLACGVLLFAASAVQQIAITMNPSTAKASFITAMYVILVPVGGIFVGRRCGARIWGCVAVAVAGLYLLCLKKGFGNVENSDWLLLLCAALFAAQILAIDRYSPLVDGVRLTLAETAVEAVCATVCALALEQPSFAVIAANALPILYCGVFSSGVAETLQVIAQKDLNPAIASIAMCLESVFGALGGWLLLRQTLSLRETAGCALIFCAVAAAQLPARRRAAHTHAG